MWVQQAVRSKRLELKNVLGEENPADLLTKHSLSRERVEKLTEFFDCNFREGSCQSAAAMRTGQSEKQTMATADACEAISKRAEKKAARSLKLHAVGAQEEKRGPFMPHVGLARSEIDRQWASLEAVEDTNFEDL